MYSHKRQNVEFKVMYERKIEGSKTKRRRRKKKPRDLRIRLNREMNKRYTHLIRKTKWALFFICLYLVLPWIEFYFIFHSINIIIRWRVYVYICRDINWVAVKAGIYSFTLKIAFITKLYLLTIWQFLNALFLFDFSDRKNCLWNSLQEL